MTSVARPDAGHPWPAGRLVVVLAAVLFTCATLSAGYVTGLGPFWQQPSGDAAQGQIGWFYYARDSWRWPLLAIGNYHLPEGGNVLLSDSLPLFAVPAKALVGLLWPPEALPPIYLGAWVALCFFVQVVAASRLLAALDVRRPLQHLAGIALLSYLPMLFLRFGHATLLAHFLILFALTGYVQAKRDRLARAGWIGLCAIPVVSLWISPYIAAMTGILVLVTLLDGWREGRLDLRGILLRLAAMLLTGLAVLGASGLHALPTENPGDYGRYSLNLLSPFVPFPGTTTGHWLQTAHPSPRDLHQWEGGSYLGAGVVLLCLAALPALRRWRTGLRRHAVLAIALVVTLLFAISHRIGFGAWELVHLPLPEVVQSALSNLRGSGRFVWLAVYALVAGCIVAVARHYRPPAATALLALAAVLQIADVAPMQREVRTASATAAGPQIDVAAWEDLIARHQRLFQFPSFECGGLYGLGVPGTRWRELQIDWVAARLNRPTNSAYLARKAKDCRHEREQATRGIREPGTLYLFRSSEDIGRLLAAHGERSAGCGYLDDVVVCSADQDLSWIDRSTLE
ncbi:DUF6311 domain-containing protein [Dokdonella koreensis]|uniref:Uncharacterized protein n=1 Tax=Dokdonella koreensis DS-123 TaxID=1300342 RepID=A0A167GMU6_9GAMM|nr:DUF6311 domain-containing protein [Dokdonella koreensis]ANB16762.1 Hypothetical protein I596_726 [Dokdonella koreensis DS-123]